MWLGLSWDLENGEWGMGSWGDMADEVDGGGREEGLGGPMWLSMWRGEDVEGRG